MINVIISEVNNGFIVTVEKHEAPEKMINPMDIGKIMEMGMKTAMKIENQDEKLNVKQKSTYLGTSVHKTWEEVVGFLKLAKEDIQ